MKKNLINKIKLQKVEEVPVAVSMFKPPFVVSKEVYSAWPLFFDNYLIEAKTILYYGKASLPGRLELFPTKKPTWLYHYIKKNNLAPLLPAAIENHVDGQSMHIVLKEMKDESEVNYFCDSIAVECPYEAYFPAFALDSKMIVEATAMRVELGWNEDYDEFELGSVTRIYLTIDDNEGIKACFVATFLGDKLIKMKLNEF